MGSTALQKSHLENNSIRCPSGSLKTSVFGIPGAVSLLISDLMSRLASDFCRSAEIEAGSNFIGNGGEVRGRAAFENERQFIGLGAEQESGRRTPNDAKPDDGSIVVELRLDVRAGEGGVSQPLDLDHLVTS